MTPPIARRERLAVVFVSVCILVVLVYIRQTFIIETHLDGLAPRVDQLDEVEYQCRHQRSLIYTCDTRFGYCGGWGDRQRGIVSVFLLSQLLNRTFALIHEKPCSIRDLFQPNIYNWRRCSPSKPLSQKDVKVHFLMSREYENQIPNITDFDDYFPEHITYITTNQRWIRGIQRHPKASSMFPWILNKTVEDIFSKTLTILFKPQPYLQNELDVFSQKYKHYHMVCVHARMGNNPDNPFDEVARMGIPDVNVILNFLSGYKDESKYKIYVASDSSAMKREVKQMLGEQVVYADVTIVHVDLYEGRTGKPCQGLHDAILEQLILSQCDTLLVTRSGFGFHAAYMREKNDLFCYVHGNNTITPCNKNDLKYLYNFN